MTLPEVLNIPGWATGALITTILLPFIFKFADGLIVSFLAKFFPKYFESFVLHIFEEINKWIEAKRNRFPQASEEFEKELICLADKIKDVLKK